MTTPDEPNTEGHRYSRNEGFFAAAGQQAISDTPVAIVGLGGLGSHVAQQLGYLGTQVFALIDHDHMTDSSLNRVVTAEDADVAPGTLKVAAAKRRILTINPTALVETVDSKLDTDAAGAAIASAKVVFGCVDNDLTRVQLTRICSRLAVPLIDLATDVDVKANPMTFGGRVVCCTGHGCLVCLGALDQHALALADMSDEQARAYEQIYGISREALGQTGPMVVSINGTVASLAVTEFIALITRLRPVIRELTYLGHQGIIRKSADQPPDGCWYCAGIWGTDRRSVAS